MKEVAFIQYLMPRGEKRYGGFMVEDNIAEMAEKMRSNGIEFDIEMLSDYKTVFVDIHAPDADG